MTRSVDELLKLDTYQDMTDEEIESVMQFKCTIAAGEAAAHAASAALEQAVDRMQNVTNRSRAHAAAMFAESCARRPQFRMVDDEQAR